MIVLSSLLFLYGPVDCFNYGCKCIFVDRTDPNCAEKLHEDIMSRINSKDEWPDILIYPEGWLLYE